MNINNNTSNPNPSTTTAQNLNAGFSKSNTSDASTNQGFILNPLAPVSALPTNNGNRSVAVHTGTKRKYDIIDSQSSNSTSSMHTFATRPKLQPQSMMEYVGDLHNRLERVSNKLQRVSYSYLYFAVQHNDIEHVEKAIQEGADVNAADNNGCTPLYIAAQNGHHSVVELLLTKGAHIDAATNNAWTPLHIAAYQGHHLVVALLIDKGTDIYVKINSGESSLEIANRLNHPSIVTILTSRID